MPGRWVFTASATGIEIPAPARGCQEVAALARPVRAGGVDPDSVFVSGHLCGVRVLIALLGMLAGGAEAMAHPIYVFTFGAEVWPHSP